MLSFPKKKYSKDIRLNRRYHFSYMHFLTFASYQIEYSFELLHIHMFIQTGCEDATKCVNETKRRRFYYFIYRYLDMFNVSCAIQ